MSNGIFIAYFCCENFRLHLQYLWHRFDRSNNSCFVNGTFWNVFFCHVFKFQARRPILVLIGNSQICNKFLPVEHFHCCSKYTVWDWQWLYVNSWCRYDWNEQPTFLTWHPLSQFTKNEKHFHISLLTCRLSGEGASGEELTKRKLFENDENT